MKFCVKLLTALACWARQSDASGREVDERKKGMCGILPLRIPRKKNSGIGTLHGQRGTSKLPTQQKVQMTISIWVKAMSLLKKRSTLASTARRRGSIEGEEG